VFENSSALIIEHDAHSLVVIAAILNELDIRFKRNTTGYDAAQQARTIHPRPDFVLLAMSLPEDDPYRIIRAFKSDTALAQIPIIAIDQQREPRDLYEMRHAGFAGFIAKPLPRRQFASFLRRALTDPHSWQTWPSVGGNPYKITDRP
jgi:CheY-like chemotaxis protein